MGWLPEKSCLHLTFDAALHHPHSRLKEHCEICSTFSLNQVRGMTIAMLEIFLHREKRAENSIRIPVHCL